MLHGGNSVSRVSRLDSELGCPAVIRGIADMRINPSSDHLTCFA